MRILFILLLLLSTAYGSKINYREEMRNLVQKLSAHAKERHPEFLIIPQNGQELITQDGREVSPPVETYLTAIDGQGRESLFYGYESENKRTPEAEQALMEGAIKVGKSKGKTILVIDYASDQDKVDQSHRLNDERGYIPFTAPGRLMTHLPTIPYKSNDRPITTLTQAQNFAIILNLSEYPDRNSFLSAMDKTHYDLLIIDAFFNDGTPWTAEEIERLKKKPNGAERLVVSYISVGEAENYRFYWKSDWRVNHPSWLARENPNWPGNFNVNYWDPAWQEIVIKYLDRILNAGFDGIYMDIIDAFWIHEEQLHKKAPPKSEI